MIIFMGVYYIPLGHGNYHVGTTGKISGVLFGDHLEIIKRHSFRDIAMSCAKEISKGDMKISSNVWAKNCMCVVNHIIQEALICAGTVQKMVKQVRRQPPQ